MKVEVIYPPVERRRLQRRRLLRILQWPFLLAAYLCPIINLLTGGKAWSVIVLMSLYMAWKLVLSTDLVEYNRISQFTKLIVCTCVLLSLIDGLLAPGWAVEVVPMVCFGGLVVAGILFFTDLERQKQNMLPMLVLIVMAMIGSVVGVSIWHDQVYWPMVVMGALALALLVGCAATLGGDFLRELKRRLHTK